MQTPNLIANGNADADPGGSGEPSAVLGWTTIEGAAAVVAYGAAGYPALTSPGPADRGRNFLSGGNSARTRLVQQVTLPWTGEIDAGGVGFDLAGWLGGYADQDDGARLSIEFLSTAGMPLGACFLGPVTAAERRNTTGLLRRNRTGTVPPGSRTARTVLLFTRDNGTSNDGYADSIVLVLVTRTTNLLTNPGADAGPGGAGSATAVIPGWTVVAGSPAVIRYGTPEYPAASSPGPADRGANFFGGGSSARSTITQTKPLPDRATFFEFGAHLGGYADQDDTATVTATFLDTAGRSVGVATLDRVGAAERGNVTGLLPRAGTGPIPAGARSVRVDILFTRAGGTSNDGYADSIFFGVVTEGL